jgi:hypothetical protein
VSKKLERTASEKNDRRPDSGSSACIIFFESKQLHLYFSINLPNVHKDIHL